jgi:Ca2+-binding EF-hand superfamily protein
MDQNGNGLIEPTEVSGRVGGFVRSMAERAGLDPNQPLPIDKLAASADSGRQDRNRARDENRGRDDERNRDERNRDERNRDDRNRDDRNRDDRSYASSSGSGSASPAPPSGVPGFGVAATGDAGPKAPGFDTPLTAVVGAPVEKRFDDRVIEYVKENILKERDLNKNSMLERNEWTGRWSTPPEESDLNKDGVLSFEELCIRIAKRFNLDPARGGAPGSASASSSPGSWPSGPGGPFGGPPGGDTARFRTYAESLIRQYDTSKNGMLEREEWKEMRSEHQSADANKDSVITVEELAAGLQAYSAGGSGGGGPGGWGSRGGGDRGGGDRGGPGGWGSRGPGGDKQMAAAKKSYRVSSPVERLPKGLPDFFVRNDTDSDGQISMAEYAATWNDQIAVEFQKLDLNGDGILTPEECVKKY